MKNMHDKLLGQPFYPLRIIWFVTLCLAISGIVFVVMNIWNEFVSKPTIISIESNQYPIWMIPFPGVALCNVNKISAKAAAAYALHLASISNYSAEVIYQNIIFMGRLLDHDIEGYEYYSRFMEFLDMYDTDSSGMYDVKQHMKMLMPSCNETLVRCRWKGVIVNCMDYFETRRTMEGFCCTFNYRRSSGVAVYEDDKLSEEILTADLPGPHQGLSVIIDPQIDDYLYTLHSSEGFDIHIFNSMDYPDATSGGLIEKFVQAETEVFLTLQATTTYGVPDVKRFSVEKRGCRFPEEMAEVFKGRYSYSECIILCRIKTVLALCKCVPFFLPSRVANARICTLADIPCLNKYKQKLTVMHPPTNTDVEGLELELEDSLFCPDCVPECSVTRFKVGSHFAPLPKTREMDLFTLDVNLTGKSILHLYYVYGETELYKMDVLYYWYEIVSNFGGICGLFMGISLISVAELIYYTTFRLYAVLKQQNIDAH